MPGHPKLMKSAKQPDEAHKCDKEEKLRRLIDDIFVTAQEHSPATTRPIREVDCRMEALEDLKQGRRGPAAEGLRHLAKVFKRDPRTIRRWIEAGHFPGAYKTEGGQWRIPASALVDTQVPAKLQSRRVKVPNRILKSQALKRFTQTNGEITHVTIILLEQYLHEKNLDSPQNANDVNHYLTDEDFVKYLKYFYDAVLSKGASFMRDTIDRLALKSAETRFQGKTSTRDMGKPEPKKMRRYRSAMTITYLANFYSVHRSTIHRWLKSDSSFKMNILEAFTRTGSEAQHHASGEIYEQANKQPSMEETDDESDLYENDYQNELNQD